MSDINKTIAAIRAETTARVVELLNKKVIQLQSENAELREALGHYADKHTWVCINTVYDSHECGDLSQRTFEGSPCCYTNYDGNGEGWEVAKAVLDKYK